MNPILKTKPYLDDDDVYHFTLAGINVSFANALRRVILSNIPTIVFHTETYQDNQCTIMKNTGRLHNEIIKQRLSCIPIHSEDNELIEKYIMELHVKNDKDEVILVTTKDFKIKNKETGNYLKEEAVHKIFPPHPITNMWIDVARLNPKICDSIDGEELHLTCEFSRKTANDNSMYNVVSKCAYGYTVDENKAKDALEILEKQWASEGLGTEELQFNVKNFNLLDKQRYYVEDSFDFVIQTVGVYTNEQICKKGAMLLYNMCVDFIKTIESNELSIHMSETTMENAYDIILDDEFYTLGKVLEFIMYEKHYMNDRLLNYCGFKKLHPHNTSSIIRLGFVEKTEKSLIQQHLISAAMDASDVFKKIMNMF